MYVQAHSAAMYGNTSGCGNLVEYLDKENEGKELIDREHFFNQDQDHITDNKVQQIIDNNHKGLKKDVAKFYMVTVNPSQRELKHLATLATGRDIENISQMSKVELDKYNTYFKAYVNKVMDEYARSFNKNITKDNLHYFAKVEQTRTYKGYDKDIKEGRVKQYYGKDDIEVRNGLAEAGHPRRKEGLQTHSHVIVSRMDKEQKMSLSPKATSRGHSKNHKLNGRSVGVGFDNMNFKVNSEKVFDKTFHYSREYKDKTAYHMLKNNAFKVLGLKKNMSMGKAVINQKALEFFTRQLGHKTVSMVMNANPYLKVAYKAVKLVQRGIDIGSKF